MTAEKTTVREEMQIKKFSSLAGTEGFEQFSPLDIDISEFKDVKNCLPSDGQLDGHMAAQLANQFLRAADRCSEILSQLIWWVQKTKADKKQAYSKAFLRAKESARMSDNVAKHKAEVDEEYLVACQAEIDAETVKERFRLKHQTFLKAFHLMKDRVKDEQQHALASGFSEATGEVSWK